VEIQLGMGVGPGQSHIVLNAVGVSQLKSWILMDLVNCAETA